MSIRTRIEDAQVLLAAGRADGALLSALVAVAATSRKRYPKSVENEDAKAFTRFLGEEVRALTAGRVANLFTFYSGADPIKYPDRMTPLQDMLYRYVRCALAHEGRLPDDIEFIALEELQFQVTADKLTFTKGLVRRLCLVVQYAPENVTEFPELSELPSDVVGWMLFGKARVNQQEYLSVRADRLAQTLRDRGICT